MENLTISLIIPAYNEEKRIRFCLESVLKNAKDELHEIIVIDNASTDNTKLIVSEFKDIKIFTEETKGVMHARNRGVKESTGDIIAFLDADNIVDREWILKVKEEFKKNKSLVCLCGKYSYYDLSKFKNHLASFYWNYIVLIASKMLGYVGNFGNMFIKRETLEKMGGLDTSIMFYGDDTDTAKRASRFGKVKFSPKISVRSTARRFNEQGLVKTTFIYALNFVTEALFTKPLTKKYKDVR